MNKFSVRTSIFIAFLAALLVVVFFVWATFRNMQLVYAESRKISACSQIQKLVDNVRQNIGSEQTAARNFIQAPNDSFLIAYKLAAFRLVGDTVNLTKILLQDSSEAAEIQQLKIELGKKSKKIDRIRI